MRLHPRSRPTSGLSVLAAVTTAGWVCFALESVFFLSSKEEAPAAYFGLCLGLGLALSLVLGLASLVLRFSLPLALATWVGVSAGLVAGPTAGLALAPVAWAVLLHSDRERTTPAFLAVCSGGGLATALLLGPRLVSQLELDLVPNPWAGPTFSAIVFAALTGPTIILAGRNAHRVSSGVLVSAACLMFLGITTKPLWKSLRAEPPAEVLLSGRALPYEGLEPKHMFLIVLDTVRADHLSVYGYERPTTPVLERVLAERPGAAIYQRAFANGSWTVPSHASLFTGRLPSDHGAQFKGALANGAWSMDADHTLAERLGQRGYASVGVFANYWLQRVAGMQRGFESYSRPDSASPLPLAGERLRRLLLPGAFADQIEGGPLGGDVNALLLREIDALRASDPERKIFAFANYTDAHGPYLPPRGFRGRFAPWQVCERAQELSVYQSAAELELTAARYDEEIASLDRYLGELFEDLERRGLWRDSWIFITSDHGEALGEHGVTEHGTALYNEITRVPLIVLPPAGVSLEDDLQPVSLVDVTATIAAIAGFDLSGPGRDLRVPVGEGHALGAVGDVVETPATALLEFYGDSSKADQHGPLAAQPALAVVRGHHKLILQAGRKQLYDLALDPFEERDIAAFERQLVTELSALLPPWETVVREEDDWTRVMNAEDLRRLQAFGYGGTAD